MKLDKHACVVLFQYSRNHLFAVEAANFSNIALQPVSASSCGFPNGRLPLVWWVVAFPTKSEVKQLENRSHRSGQMISAGTKIVERYKI
jgi:hypothetical protein